MAKGERTYYYRRHVCTTCGWITRYWPHGDLCNSCGGRMRAGIVKGAERRVPRSWWRSPRWEEDTASEVFFRWEDEGMPAETAVAS